MAARSDRGGRIGWWGGGIGSQLWVPAVAAVHAHLGGWVTASFGLGLFVLGLAALWWAAPWRWPDTPIRKLYLVLLVVIALQVGVLALPWILSGEVVAGGLPALLLLGLPLMTLGKRTWRDIHGG